jgi:Xaa-Pro aminopeptidase
MTTMIGNVDLEELGAVLRQRGLDGWLIFEFKGLNPIAVRVLRASGMLTRRIFVWLPAVGPARLIVHNIDAPALADFPGEVDVYTTWQDLHQRLASVVRGRRIAIETSPEGAVPYLDRVPSGIVELLGRLGAKLVSSAPLVSRFAARWSSAELADHRHAAELLAGIAQRAIRQSLGEIGATTEVELQQRVIDAIRAADLILDDPPVVAFGANAADPHYNPHQGGPRVLRDGDVVLLDLWARRSPHTVWADQTWMGFAGGGPPAEVVRVWEAVRDARDAVVERLRRASAAHEPVTGADLDRTARDLIGQRGFGAAFLHRTGHSIEIDIHGSGPHLDDFETHDVREIVPGVGFSVEPGVYLPGNFGVRSEVNVYQSDGGPIVTPSTPQRNLITL